MAVTIRLARHGRKKVPFYRIVAADKARKRNGRYLELLGTVNTLTDPITVVLKADRVKHWINLGAYPSDTVRSIIKGQIAGFIEGIEAGRLDKVKAKRKKRKARVAKSGKAEKKVKSEKKATKATKAKAAKK